MEQIGWAADGFPIYYDSNARSGYRKKSGVRPSGPGGSYDGSFTQDYEYVSHSGGLDECNGQFSMTPEFPEGIYHYDVTPDFPFVPRCHKGVADPSFVKERPHSREPARGSGMGHGPGHGRPPAEAINACSGKSEGDSCGFHAPHGTVSGVCHDIQGEFACLPFDHQ